MMVLIPINWIYTDTEQIVEIHFCTFEKMIKITDLHSIIFHVGYLLQTINGKHHIQVSRVKIVLPIFDGDLYIGRGPIVNSWDHAFLLPQKLIF